MQRQNNNAALSISDILNYDPLVSDMACQNRAVFLVDVAKRIITGGRLSNEELEAIEASAILTKTKQSARHPLGYIDKEVTEANELADDILIKFINEKSQELNIKNKAKLGQKRKVVAYYKRLLATATIKYLQEKTAVKLLGDYELYNNSQNLAYFTLEDLSIPILPIYISAKMLMQYIIRNDVPLVVNFTRVQSDGENENCIGSASFCYRSGKEDYLSETSLDEIEPVIIADIFSFIGNKYNCDSPFLTENSFDACVESFKELGMLAVVMLAAAAHYPYSKKTKTKISNDPMFNLPDPVENVANADFTPINLDQCSPKEFAGLRMTANRLGFFQKRVEIDHIHPGLKGGGCNEKNSK